MSLKCGSSAVATPVVPIDRHWRLYTLPYLILYSIILGIGLSSDEYGHISLLTLPLFAISQLLLFLSTHWSIKWKHVLDFRKAPSVDVASHVCVAPLPRKGKLFKKMQIRPLIRTNAVSGEVITSFELDKKKFIFDASEKRFEKIHYPTAETLKTYWNSRGLATAASLTEAQNRWGPNTFDIPLPTFGDLFKEHAVAPFFVFQLFCVGLWCLDEYWYYSIFTLLMLVMFECTVVKQRLRNLEELRSMRVPTQQVMVYRLNKWVTVSSDELVPGDLVSVVRGKDDGVILPCDMLLLFGSCVTNEAMLTGESVPQLKECIEGSELMDTLDIRSRDKRHILFGGTKVLQHTVEKPDQPHFKAPNGGCVAYVLRTGFHTSQGKLVRTILFSSERITANSKEAFLFIGCLLVFAIMAAGYVAMKGLEDETRSRYKLLLSCTLIITSVVPPELPMELALAVNTSLIALARKAVFCTEPFRIPFAGKVDVVCFDKTGTLTSDNFVVQGLAGVSGDNNEDLTVLSDAPFASLVVMGGCHSLVHIDNGLVGDPIEKVTLQTMQWTYTQSNVAQSNKKHPGGEIRVRIIHRFAFSSELKRMAVVVKVEHGAIDEYWVVVKGAPEVLRDRYTQRPANFDELYSRYSRRGARVLALGYKKLDSPQPAGFHRELIRDEVERDLIFAGVLVLECPLKSHSKATVQQLRASSHQVLMITGDNPLTACQVSKDLEILEASADPLILNVSSKNQLEWHSVDDKVVAALDTSSVSQLRKQVTDLRLRHGLCVHGDALNLLQNQHAQLLPPLIQAAVVFARVSPAHKELVVGSLNDAGHVTLMCGDGTNDVGALKRAHVGVALLNGEKSKVKPKKKEPLTASQFIAQQQQLAAARRAAANGPNASGSQANRPTLSFSDLASQLAEGEEGQLVRLGDASIASPFTSKLPTVKSVVRIIRQGRCTLVTTLQMCKILALNCLISAYCLSVLYLDGVKLGDTQATLAGMSIAVFFLFISRAKPIKTLSAERPPSSIFDPAIIISLVIQFVIHLGCLITAVHMAQPYTVRDESFVPDAQFKPNLINTVVYLMSGNMQTATFIANYRGAPFMEDLKHNVPLYKSLVAYTILNLACATDMIPGLSELFELVSPPHASFRNELVLLMLFDLFSVCVVEKVVLWLFRSRHTAKRTLSN